MATVVVEIGRTATGAMVALPLRLANRHGLVTGATGTGKTVSLQCLAEQFSAGGRFARAKPLSETRSDNRRQRGPEEDSQAKPG